MLVNCLIQIASILHKECIQFFITFQDDFSFFAFNKVEIKHKLNGKTLVLTFHGFLQSFKSRDNVRTQQKALLHPSTHLPCGWGKDTGSRVSKLQKKASVWSRELKVTWNARCNLVLGILPNNGMRYLEQNN